MFHNRRISRHAYPVLAQAMQMLAEKAWMPPELADQFTKAVRHCRRKLRHK